MGWALDDGMLVDEKLVEHLISSSNISSDSNECNLDPGGSGGAMAVECEGNVDPEAWP